MGQPESGLRQRHLAALRRAGWLAHGNHGTALSGAGRPDIEACAGGWYVGIEVKRRGARGASPAQRRRIERIRRAGGLAFVSRDPGSAVLWIRAWLRWPRIRKEIAKMAEELDLSFLRHYLSPEDFAALEQADPTSTQEAPVEEEEVVEDPSSDWDELDGEDEPYSIVESVTSPAEGASPPDGEATAAAPTLEASTTEDRLLQRLDRVIELLERLTELLTRELSGSREDQLRRRSRRGG